MLAVTSQQTTSSYDTTPAILQGLVDDSNGGFAIASAPALAQVQYGGQGATDWSSEFEVPSGGLDLAPGVVGIRFRSVAPASPAILSIALFRKDEPPVRLASLGNVTVQGVTVNFQHDGVQVAAESTLDFEDDPTISWAVVDTPGVKVAVTPSIVSSVALPGAPTTTTPATIDNSTKIATTAFVKAQGYITNAPVASVFGRTGAVAAQTGDYTAAQVTNAADKASASQQAFTGEVKAPDFTAAGLTGSTAATRWVGATASAAPTTGAHLVGDWVVTQTGHVFVCTGAGTPGTWTDAGSLGNLVTSVHGRTGAVVAVSGDYTAAQVTNAADKASGATQTFAADVAAPTFLGTFTSASQVIGTVTPNYALGQAFQFDFTGASGAVTIASPTNPPAAGQAAPLILQISNDTNTTNITFTWAAAYQFGTIAPKPTTLALGSAVTLLFWWTNGLWYCFGKV